MNIKYAAIGLNESLEKGRVSGKLELRKSTLIFRYNEEALRYNLNRLKITQGGTGNRFVYFKSSEHPDWTVYTDEKSILKRPEIRSNPKLSQASTRITNNRNLFNLTVISLVALCVFLIVGFFLFRGPIISKIAESIPTSWERELSSSMLESVLTGKTVIENETITNQLEKITKPLTEGLNDPQFTFSFTIIEDTTLNAFALPGGDIVIHSGLILKADNVNEVAGVLAHEISHVTQRHHLRGMIDKIGFFMVLRALLGDVSGIGAELAMAGATLESLKYSRKYESEADETGWDLLLRSNIDPQGMIGFFKKLADEYDLEDDNEALLALTNYLSTHPNTNKRIKKLESKDLESAIYNNIEIDFNGFQQEVEEFITN